jgi:hypothetical protein
MQADRRHIESSDQAAETVRRALRAQRGAVVIGEHQVGEVG